MKGKGSIRALNSCLIYGNILLAIPSPEEGFTV